MYGKIKLPDTWRECKMNWKKINQNYSINEQGEVRNDNTGHIKAAYKNAKNGYMYVDLWENNKSVKRPIHRLLAEAFIQNPENKPTVDHIDGNRQNNSLGNLRWATYSEQNSRFNSVGVRAKKIKVSHFFESRKERGGGHESWGRVDRIMYFDMIGSAASYFKVNISNISLMLKKGTIGKRGKMRGYMFEYDGSERVTFS